jgi:hypothetical protein
MPNFNAWNLMNRPRICSSWRLIETTPFLAAENPDVICALAPEAVLERLPISAPTSRNAFPVFPSAAWSLNVKSRLDNAILSS